MTKDRSLGNPKRKSDDAQNSLLTAQPSVMLIGKSRETVDIALPDASLGDARNTDTTPRTIEKSNVEGSTSDKSILVSQPKVSSLSSGSTTLLVGEVNPPVPSGWLDWFGVSNNAQATRANQPSNPPPPDNTVATLEHDKGTTDQVDCPTTSREPDKVAGRSWLGLWPSFTASRSKDDTITNSQDVVGMNVPNASLREEMPNNSLEQAPGSFWAFWSRSTGEAVNEDESIVTQGIPPNLPTLSHVAATQESKGVDVAVESQRNKERPSSSVERVSRLEPSKPSLTPRVGSPKSSPDNLLLPAFRETYQTMENPSVIQQIACFLMRSRQPQTKHVHLLREPPKIKKAIAIGIHGLFPAALLRTVIGQPTGTSIRFANHAAAAIHRWADKHGSQCDVEKIALDGEGKISERVDSLWKLLLNWVDHIRYADFIIVACHSQGVPVAIMLIAKLIEFGVVTATRIGVCAMGENNFITLLNG